MDNCKLLAVVILCRVLSIPLYFGNFYVKVVL